MPLTVKIIDPNAVVFEGEAKFVMAPGKSGVLGIMPSHGQLYAELVHGEIIIEGVEHKVIPVESGVLKVRNDTVTILVGLI